MRNFLEMRKIRTRGEWISLQRAIKILNRFILFLCLLLVLILLAGIYSLIKMM